MVAGRRRGILLEDAGFFFLFYSLFTEGRGQDLRDAILGRAVWVDADFGDSLGLIKMHDCCNLRFEKEKSESWREIE